MVRDIPEAMKVLNKRLESYGTPESYRAGLALKAQPEDVILTTAQKAGTTWILQILHTLRSKGDLCFEEMLMEIPTLEGAQVYGYGDVNKPQRFSPRMFSTHVGYPNVPKGAGKYIFCMRDPYDTAASYYHYLCGWLFTAEEVPIDDFIEFQWLTRGDNSRGDIWPSQFHHIASWYPHRLDENVLWLHYEDLKEDLPKAVKKIAHFLDIGADDHELQELVVKHASISFMKQHQSKFDSHILKKTFNTPMGLPADAGLTGHHGRVRDGKTGSGKQELSAYVIDLIDDKWKSILEPLTGCKNYEELRTSIHQEEKEESY